MRVELKAMSLARPTALNYEVLTSYDRHEVFVDAFVDFLLNHCGDPR